MSENTAQRHSNTYTAPGKVFLLGEYSVLVGKPAVVATLKPRFQLEIRETESDPFHPQSPAARLIAYAAKKGGIAPKLHFENPFTELGHGPGGFGGSTAQFALVYRVLSDRYPDLFDARWDLVWKLYRELFASEPTPPSGADLAAQWNGGIVEFEFANGANEGNGGAHCANLWNVCDWSSLMVFSAASQSGRKVATHEHLKKVTHSLWRQNPKLLEQLTSITEAGLEAIESDDLPELGRALNSYGDALRVADLEIPATSTDRQALGSLPGVLGIKGTGALQADALVVLVDPEQCAQHSRKKIIEAAQGRGLTLVSDGLSSETGVTCQM